MQVENKKLSTLKLTERLKGFQDVADYKKPATGDIYLSSTSGHLKVWKHDHDAKAYKVVLRPIVTVDMTTLPKGLLVNRNGFDQHFISISGVDLKGATLSNQWQANKWRNCPFKKDTVMVEVKTFRGPYSGLCKSFQSSSEAKSWDWENVAQFRVTGLFKGVEYKVHESVRPSYSTNPTYRGVF